MKNKTLKIVSAIVLILLLLSIGITTIYAAGPLDGININTGAQGATEIKNFGGNLLGIIQIIGSLVAVAMLLYLGIKYMISSPDDRASIKHSSTVYVIGAIILFAAVNIVNILYNFAQGSFKSGS